MYLLGVDAGSTITKVALFDYNGREIQTANRRIDTIQQYPGWVERDMNLVWQHTSDAIREVVRNAGIPPSQITGVGCTGHGNGAYLLDTSGEPLGYAIHAIDTRAAKLLDEWESQGILQDIQQATLQQAYAGQTACVLAWLKSNDRDRYDSIGTVLLCKDFINYRLTGETKTDFSDMGCTNLLDVANGSYSGELLAALGLSEIASKLPALCQSSAIIGNVTAEAAESTGLKASTPVVAGMIDLAANAVGTGCVTPGQACIVAGTWGINQVVTQQPVQDSSVFLNTFSANLSRYLIVEGSATSTTNLEWFINRCAGEAHDLAAQRGVSVYEICNEWVEKTDIETTKVIFHPFLYASNMGGSAQAGFYGLTGWDTPASMLRAIYEGVAFAHLTHIDNLRQAGADFDVARFTGGAARSAVWSQMFADIIQVPLEVVNSDETGTRGAALVAGVALGIYLSIEDAANRCVDVDRKYTPNPAHSKAYAKRYHAYQEIARGMQHAWHLIEQL